MRLEDFPRPKEDNGRGLHWSPSVYPPSGSALDFWLDELRAMHIRWVKVLDDGKGSSLELCRRLVDEGIMPVVRIHRVRPWPRKLTQEERTTVRRLVDVGVRYFETDSNPDLPSEWGGHLPPNWLDQVAGAFIEDATFILEAGGLPGLPGMTPRPEHNLVQAVVARSGQDLFAQGAWMAIHNYTLNRPLDYPDDMVNRKGVPVTPEEYKRHHPWGWNEPIELINRWRAEGRQPDITIAEDPECFRAYELAGEMAYQALGFHIPVISTEGGAVTGWRDDRRYPRLDPWTAAEWTVHMFNFLQTEAPPWYFALCHWLIADRRMDPSRPHAWEPHCWYTHWWDETFGFDGVLPVVEQVKAMPTQARPLAPAAPVPEAPTTVEAAPPPAEKTAPAVATAPPDAGDTTADTPEEGEMAGTAEIQGQVHDEHGAALAGVRVVLFRGDSPLVETITDATGHFHVEMPAPARYEIALADRGVLVSVDVRPDDVKEITVILHGDVPREEPAAEAPLTPEEAPPAEAEPKPPTEPEPEPEPAPEPEAEPEPEPTPEPVEPTTAAAEPAPEPAAAEPPVEDVPAPEEPAPAEPLAAEAAPPAEPEPEPVPEPEPEAEPESEPEPAPAEAETPAVTEDAEAEEEEPPQGSRVVGVIHGGRPRLTLLLTAEEGQAWETLVDRDHRFAFDALPPGAYRLELVGIGVIRDRIVLDGRNEVEVEFPMRGVIQGLVMGGTPEMEARLISDTYGWERTVALSPQGQYRFTELPPGTYRVRVGDQEVGPVEIDGNTIQRMEVLDLRPPHRASIRGRVRDAEGNVLPEVPVRLLQAGNLVAAVETALNGEYVFENMPPGEYQLVALGPPDVVRTVRLEQDKEILLDLQLGPEPVAEEAPTAEAAEEATPPAEAPAPAPVVEPTVEEEPLIVESAPFVPLDEPEPEEATEAPPEPAPQAEAPADTGTPTAAEDISWEETYILLPPPGHPVAHATVLALLPFLRRHPVTAGFRVEEAQAARRVLIVGGEHIYGPEVEEALRTAGCDVDRVSEDPIQLLPLIRQLAGG